MESDFHWRGKVTEWLATGCLQNRRSEFKDRSTPPAVIELSVGSLPAPGSEARKSTFALRITEWHRSFVLLIWSYLILLWIRVRQVLINWMADGGREKARVGISVSRFLFYDRI